MPTYLVGAQRAPRLPCDGSVGVSTEVGSHSTRRLIFFFFGDSLKQIRCDSYGLYTNRELQACASLSHRAAIRLCCRAHLGRRVFHALLLNKKKSAHCASCSANVEPICSRACRLGSASPGKRAGDVCRMKIWRAGREPHDCRAKAEQLPRLGNILSRLLFELPKVPGLVSLELPLVHGHLDESLLDALAHTLG